MNSNKVFVNRTLNLKRIRYIGLDMDHTLIRYNSHNFEKLSYETMKDKLVRHFGYPEGIRSLQFSFNLAIRGLVLDRKKGNLLKLNQYGAIRTSYHGTKPIDYKTQQTIYKSIYIDLSDKDYQSVDTTFSISHATLFAQLVDLKDASPHDYPEYAQIADDVLEALDEAHRDGSIKDQVKKQLDQYVIKDPKVVENLERFKVHGKKIFVLTNSDFFYTKLLLDYAINPFLKNHKTWFELFELVITFANKPRFFVDNLKYLSVSAEDGRMLNFEGKLGPGVYQGGSASVFTRDLDVEGDEILYIGDHIYGDILRLKKDCNWRTAMVIEELEEELNSNLKALPIDNEIELLMQQKAPQELRLTDLMTTRVESPEKVNDKEIEALQDEIAVIDSKISQLIKQQQSLYNPYWGQLMRAGNEESYFASQMERYACIYMPKIGDMLELSPRTYFRAPRRPLAHELLPMAHSPDVEGK